MLVREQFTQTTVACVSCGHTNDERSEWCSDCLTDLPIPTAVNPRLRRHYGSRTR